MKMYYIIYETTNTINGKTYRGSHKTDFLDDGYLGSGVLLKKAIKKYGKEHFKREILLFCSDEKEMYSKESEMVIISKNTYNLKEGGFGGFGYINKNKLNNINKSPEVREKRSKTLSKYRKQKCKEPQELDFMKQISEKGRKVISEKYPEGIWKGKKHTEETKKKIGEISKVTQAGSNNSQYGTCWVTNGEVNKKIKKEELDNYIDLGYNKGRIVK